MTNYSLGLLKETTIDRMRSLKLKADYQAWKKSTNEEWLNVLLDAWEKQNADK